MLMNVGKYSRVFLVCLTLISYVLPTRGIALELNRKQNEKVERLLEGEEVYQDGATYSEDGTKFIMPKDMFDYYLVRDLQLDLADKRIAELNERGESTGDSGFSFLLGVGLGIFGSVTIGCLFVTDCRQR